MIGGTCPACASTDVAEIAPAKDVGKNAVCRDCDFQWTIGGRAKRSAAAYARNRLNWGSS